MSPSHSLSLRASLHPSPTSDVERLRPTDNHRPVRRIKASGAWEAGGEDERGMRGRVLGEGGHRAGAFGDEQKKGARERRDRTDF